MKKSELRQIIREQIKIVLKEENELLKAQDACKATMFKLKPELEKLFKKAEELGYLESYNIKIEPYNQGYMLKWQNKLNYRNAENFDKKNKGLYYVVGGSESITLQPDTFFEDKMIEGGSSQIIGNSVPADGKYKSVRYPISDKNGIKTATERFYRENSQTIKVLTNSLK